MLPCNDSLLTSLELNIVLDLLDRLLRPGIVNIDCDGDEERSTYVLDKLLKFVTEEFADFNV